MAKRKNTPSLSGFSEGNPGTDRSRASWARMVAERDQQLRAQERQLGALAGELAAQRAQAARDTSRWRKACERKSGLIATVSHELRTPLNSMLALTDLLREGLVGPLTADQRKYLDVIQRNGQTLLELVSGILDLSRLESGRVALNLQCHDAALSLRAVTAALAPLARAKGLDLIMDVVPQPLPVLCDSTALQQVLTNLIGNAIKFTDSGDVTVGVRARDERVELSVSDTGMGIPAAAQEQVFDQFFQVDSGGGHGKGGSGLGLAIARRLARLMGGDIRVDSTVGVGSRFTLTLARGADPSAWAGPAATQNVTGLRGKEGEYGAHTPRR